MNPDSSPARFTDRMEILLGREGIDILSRSRVAIYGLGGVGAACALDLVRAGIGSLKVVDFDLVEISNLNRLAFGTIDVVGKPKIDGFAELALKINPEIRIETSREFFSGEDAPRIVDQEAAVHADCVDSLNSKVQLLASLRRCKATFISSMGTAGRLAPERLKLGLLEESSGCPLAREVRNRLRRLGVPLDFPVVWSDEPAVPPRLPSVSREGASAEANTFRPAGRLRGVQGSSPFVPQVAGHIMASWIVRTILGKLE